MHTSAEHAKLNTFSLQSDNKHVESILIGHQGVSSRVDRAVTRLLRAIKQIIF